jgi:hypothetical protein
MERVKIFIPATKTPGFRAFSTLKDALKEGWLCSSWPELLRWIPTTIRCVTRCSVNMCLRMYAD